MPKPTAMVQPNLIRMGTQEEGVDPLEEIDPYPGDDEVKEIDPLADPLGGVSPPRAEEEGPTSDLGAIILG